MNDRLSDRVGEVVRQAIEGFRRPDPARELARKRRKARRSLWIRGTAAGGLLVVTLAVGDQGGIEWSEAVAGGATAIAAVAAADSARRVVNLRRVPEPIAAPTAPPLPPRGTIARKPLAQLAERERSLYELLLIMGEPGKPTWHEATTAAAALREQGARLVAVESAVKGAGEASPELREARQVMLDRLEDGVGAYDRLVGAAAEAVAASGRAAPDTPSVRRLEESADALLGLARGLREVSDLLPPSIRDVLPPEEPRG